MAVDDVYQVEFTAQAPGGFYQNTLAFRVTDAVEPTEAEFITLANDFKTVWLQEQHTSVTWRSWRARQVRGAGVSWPSGTSCSPVGGKLFEGAPTGTLIGGEATDMLPPQCALVVTLRTAEIGRRRRGRIYAFGWCETQQVGGTWTSAFQTLILGRLATFITKYAPVTPIPHLQLGVWSYRTASGCEQNASGGGHTRVDTPNPAQAFTPVTATTLRPTVHTQRRRVVGVGR